MLSLVVIELQHRAPRVRFRHPVRVVPLDGSPRIYRTLTANLSRRGMFVRMPEPLPKGTRVALSLEAGGQALPFAEAEIAWCRTSESQLPGRFTGFGVRFTSFLNPRAPELVEYLVKNLDRGRPLKMAPPKSARRRHLIGLAAGALALVVAGGLGARALLQWAAADDEAVTPEVSAVAAPPVARTENAVEPPTALAAADDVAAPAPAEVAPSAVDAETAPVPEPAAVAVPTDAEPTPAAVAPADGSARPAPPADEASAPTIAGAELAPRPAAAAAKVTSADEAPAPTTARAELAPTAAKTPADEAPAPTTARAELAPKAAPADDAPAPTTARAELAPKAAPADEAPAPTTARAGLAPKAMPAEPAPAPKIAAAKSKPGASAQGRLALPSGAAQTLSWEERGGAIHVGLALAPGATVGRRFLLAGPPRLVMDLDGRAPKKSLTLEAKAPWLKQVRIGPHGASTRVVVDLASPPAQMTQGEDGVTLTFAR